MIMDKNTTKKIKEYEKKLSKFEKRHPAITTGVAVGASVTAGVGVLCIGQHVTTTIYCGIRRLREKRRLKKEENNNVGA